MSRAPLPYMRLNTFCPLMHTLSSNSLFLLLSKMLVKQVRSYISQNIKSRKYNSGLSFCSFSIWKEEKIKRWNPTSLDKNYPFIKKQAILPISDYLFIGIAFKNLVTFNMALVFLAWSYCVFINQIIQNCYISFQEGKKLQTHVRHAILRHSC